ncbi:hypothetical protein C900_03893 [Fulvivirga imtechensis AK7]|uniref:Uncharacterized protein n=2 Tax=Fulvivirga TaxID=396811 RepID=L8JPT1_9BACT|nr:hypothetical protein C900_03893 [Fulvivirga imtechensis AK7]
MYFDPEESVVYHQQTADVFGLIALVLIILTVVLLIIRKKSK